MGFPKVISRPLFCCALLLAAASIVRADTTWGYISSNAFPSLVFSNPVCITAPPGETNRLFILEKHGRIVVITNLAAPTRAIFMDLSAQVSVDNGNDTNDTTGEEGLLGLAFHPGYATNRTFFLYYTGQATNGSGTLQLHDILARFQTTVTNANVALTNSQTQLIAQYDLANNHNAGDIHFGKDGYLYVSLGDEGGANDQYGNSQHIDKDYFSAFMRLDVDKRPGNLVPNPHVSIVTPTNYFVPADNPWVGATNFNGATVNSNNVRTEFWAVGMRNPWRWSFDSDGEIYLGHVGQSAIEWIDLVTRGCNCGWNYMEGDTAGPGGTPPPGFTYTHPLVEYSHTGGRNCIIGGIVYRGSHWPQLGGTYFYADHGSGEIWALQHSGTNVTLNTVVLIDSGAGICAFGIDPSNGDPLYAACRSGYNSLIKRIVATNSVPVVNSVKLSGTNLFIKGTNGPHTGSFYVLTSTNLGAPPANWLRAFTNPFDSSGNFNSTNPVGRTNLFYLLQLQ
jgi:glucose/arabinose dehydrogenase